ncbi:MAG: YezD family protein [Syntrophaceae bacterium]|nr:YezD family protein [Syntrophaceae bacterium]
MEKAISNFKINEEELLSHILKAIRSIRYGYVQIIVQDSKVVQIDKTEKIRLDREMGGNR